jgi:hypothetical protein
MPRFIVCIAVVTLATVCLLAGRASAAAGNPCGNSANYSAAPFVQSTVWRMEVREDEAAYTVPSIRDRLIHNWSDDAKRIYRWTSTSMPVDAGASTQLMAISAAVIGDGVPVLEKGDVVDVDVVQGIDYSQGRAPVVVRRVCAARDVACMDELRRMQEGRAAEVEVRGADQVASYWKPFPPVANVCRSAPLDMCHGEVAAALQ